MRDYVAMYIPGDFSEAVIRAGKYKKSGFGPYNPVAHNCLHYAQELLKSGTCYDWAMQESISKANGFIPVTYIYDVMKGYNYAKQRIRGRLVGW